MRSRLSSKERSGRRVRICLMTAKAWAFWDGTWSIFRFCNFIFFRFQCCPYTVLSIIHVLTYFTNLYMNMIRTKEVYLQIFSNQMFSFHLTKYMFSFDIFVGPPCQLDPLFYFKLCFFLVNITLVFFIY